VRVVTATRDAFIDMFDADDLLEYEPATTAAVILVGGDEDAEKAARLVRFFFRTFTLALHILRGRRQRGRQKGRAAGALAVQICFLTSMPSTSL